MIIIMNSNIVGGTGVGTGVGGGFSFSNKNLTLPVLPSGNSNSV